VELAPDRIFHVRPAVTAEVPGEYEGEVDTVVVRRRRVCGPARQLGGAA
jgi:hypothetical protein